MLARDSHGYPEDQKSSCALYILAPKLYIVDYPWCIKPIAREYHKIGGLSLPRGSPICEAKCLQMACRPFCLLQLNLLLARLLCIAVSQVVRFCSLLFLPVGVQQYPLMACFAANMYTSLASVTCPHWKLRRSLGFWFVKVRQFLTFKGLTLPMFKIFDFFFFIPRTIGYSTAQLYHDI